MCMLMHTYYTSGDHFVLFQGSLHVRSGFRGEIEELDHRRQAPSPGKRLVNAFRSLGQQCAGSPDLALTSAGDVME